MATSTSFWVHLAGSPSSIPPCICPLIYLSSCSLNVDWCLQKSDAVTYLGLKVISVTSMSEIGPMAAKLKLGVKAPAGQTAYWVQMK